MTPYRNQKLFSNHYLERLLPEEKEFEINEAELKEAYQKIRALWDKNRFSSLNESQLRKHFLDKVFEILGWTVDVEPPTLIGDGIKHPDYALFYSKNDLKVVQKTPKEKYFKHVACLAEAKRWERNLDKKIKSDPEDIQNPSLQMSHYLWLTEVKWGILTNGRYWRLYERETSKKIDIFYEIDLESLLENGKLEDFRYFYLFFRKDAFPAFVEKIYQGSKDYAEAVGEELKENVYESLRLLAHGFLEFPNNSLSQNDLKKIHDNSLIFLYRLLFIFYAEYNQLLPLRENKAYTDYYSLDAIKKEITDKIDKRKHLPISTHTYWDRLKELFEIINNGNKELDVPPYNGGLFDPKKHHFLEDYKVGDAYVAKVIDLLSRSKEKAFIDYSSLDIRHLGSIYEGLLEYKLRIAKEDLVPIKQKGREV
ncbi:MAG: class I SAM-dependent DNA methyltransferase, partial [Thermodesulfobacteriota bacterium]